MTDSNLISWYLKDQKITSASIELRSGTFKGGKSEPISKQTGAKLKPPA